MKNLSKSQYTRGLQCTKSLWLYHNGREHQGKPGADAQTRMDEGTEVGVLAQTYFPGGTLISEDHLHPKEAIESTKKAINSGAKVLYEAAFLHDNVLVRVDILVKKEDDSWHLIEVKGSTKVKDYHLDDVSLQVYVLKGAGIIVKNASVMFVSKDYVREGDVNVKELFVIQNVDSSIVVMDRVSGIVHAFRGMVQEDECPSVGIGARCTTPNPCDFKDYCWKDVPEDSVFSIGGIRKAKAEVLWNSGTKKIADIPTHVEFKGRQAKQVQVMKSGNALINHKEIEKLLSTLRYPLYSLDFETVGPTIPPYPGLKPFQNLTFQASVHIQKEPGGALDHKELLAEPDHDPREEMAEFLSEAIGPNGSVVAYNASFEKNCLIKLGNHIKKRTDSMFSIVDRLWDLMLPFKDDYIDPRFHGKYSLKAVLPTLIPELAYNDLNISGGADASALYKMAMQGKLSDFDKGVLFADLKKYCGRDTLGPIHLIDFLRLLVETKKDEN